MDTAPPPLVEPLARIVKASELARIAGREVEIRKPDGSWAPVDRQRSGGYGSALASINNTLRNWAVELGWQEAYAQMVEHLGPVRSQQGVTVVTADATGIHVSIRGFQSRAQLNATQWVKVELRGTFLFAYNRITVTNSHGTFQGREVGRWPNVQSSGSICLDAGMTFYNAAMQAGDALQAILGVLTQMRSLNDGGYTRVGIWLGIGCRNCGSIATPTLGGYCSYCKRLCVVCKTWAKLGDTNALVAVANAHGACLRTCRVCGSVPINPSECPVEPCVICKEPGKHRQMTKLMNKANFDQVAHVACATQHYCGFFNAPNTKCVICSSSCFVCSKYVRQADRQTISSPTGSPFYLIHIGCVAGNTWRCGTCNQIFAGTDHERCPYEAYSEVHSASYAAAHPFTDADYAAAGERRVVIDAGVTEVGPAMEDGGPVPRRVTNTNDDGEDSD